mgnify:CR=1 FL=1
MHKICGQSLCIITHCAKCRISGCRPAKILCIFSLDKCCRLCYTETRRARTASAPMCHGTRIPLPWYPYPYTHGIPYLHTCIDTFVLFIYLFYYLCVCLSYCLCLSYSSLLSCSLSSRSLLALGKACPWAGAAGLISLVCANVLFYLIIIQ